MKLSAAWPSLVALGAIMLIGVSEGLNCYDCQSSGPQAGVDCASGTCVGNSCWMQILKEGDQFSVAKFCGDANMYMTAGLTSGNDSCNVANPPGAPTPTLFCVCNSNDMCTGVGQLQNFRAYKVFTGSGPTVPNIGPGSNPAGNGFFPPPPPPGDNTGPTNGGGNQLVPQQQGFPPQQQTPPNPPQVVNGGSRPEPPPPRGPGGGVHSRPPPQMISGTSDTAVGQPPSPIPVNHGGFQQMPANISSGDSNMLVPLSGPGSGSGTGTGQGPQQTVPRRDNTTTVAPLSPPNNNTTAAFLVASPTTVPSGNGQQKIYLNELLLFFVVVSALLHV